MGNDHARFFLCMLRFLFVGVFNTRNTKLVTINPSALRSIINTRTSFSQLTGVIVETAAFRWFKMDGRKACRLSKACLWKVFSFWYLRLPGYVTITKPELHPACQLVVAPSQTQCSWGKIRVRATRTPRRPASVAWSQFSSPTEAPSHAGLAELHGSEAGNVLSRPGQDPKHTWGPTSALKEYKYTPNGKGQFPDLET